MRKSYNVFLIDDDTKTLLLQKQYLETNCKHDLNIRIFDSGEEALEVLDSNTHFIILDYYLDSVHEDAKSGLEILKAIKERQPNTEVVVMSGQDNMETTLELLRKGAYDYIIKGETAMARSQIIIDGLIERQLSLEQIQHYRTGYKYALTAAFIFLLMLVAVILKYYNVY